MSADNRPLCLTCHSEYTCDLLSTSTLTNENVGWQTRFCSAQCADQFMVIQRKKPILCITTISMGPILQLLGKIKRYLYKKVMCKVIRQYNKLSGRLSCGSDIAAGLLLFCHILTCCLSLHWSLLGFGSVSRSVMLWCQSCTHCLSPVTIQ